MSWLTNLTLMMRATCTTFTIFVTRLTGPRFNCLTSIKTYIAKILTFSFSRVFCLKIIRFALLAEVAKIDVGLLAFRAIILTSRGLAFSSLAVASFSIVTGVLATIWGRNQFFIVTSLTFVVTGSCTLCAERMAFLTFL